MERLQYKVIKSVAQYKSYRKLLEELVTDKKNYRANEDAVELLTLLVETWDREHGTFADAHPVELLAFLMKEYKYTSVRLSTELEIGKSLISDILNYRRGFSKEVIRKLADRFKVPQESFNRPYNLEAPAKGRSK